MQFHCIVLATKKLHTGKQSQAFWYRLYVVNMEFMHTQIVHF